MPITLLKWTLDDPYEPCYVIDHRGCIRPDSRLFYTDNNIRNDQYEAAESAEYIMEESSGIADARVQQLGELRGILL